MATPNPITDVEPDQVTIWPEHTLGGVGLEVVDSSGNGFRTVLDQMPALDAALRLIGAIMRLRGIAP